MNQKKLEACIFDLDGVLVDTAKYHYLAWKRLADHLSIYFDEEMNEQLKGVSRVKSLEQILKWGKVEMDEEEQAKLRYTKNQWYLEYLETLDESEILPHAREFVSHAKESGLKIALGSASKNAVKVLNMTGLNKYFDVVIDGNSTINSKPHPEVFLKAADALACNPENAIVFEDSERGIEAANIGNFKSVGIGKPDILNKAMMVLPDFENIKIDHFNRLFE